MTVLFYDKFNFKSNTKQLRNNQTTIDYRFPDYKLNNQMENHKTKN